MGLYDKRPTPLPRIWKVALGILWALGVGGTMAAAMRYEATPGKAGIASDHARAGREVVMVVHPECPCTAASVQAFQRLLDEAKVPVRARLLIVAYGKPDHDIAREKYAQAVPGARPAWIKADEAKVRYGALTSGHTVGYLDGKPVFSGGLTSGRGVESPSGSQWQLREFLEGKPIHSATPVFGCALNGEKL